LDGYNGGLSRYDGQSLQSYTLKNGLPYGKQYVPPREDTLGRLWLGSGGGVICYDGRAFSQISSKDGLPSEIVETLHLDNEGAFWIGTRKGLVRYMPSMVPPRMRINELVADRQYKPTDTVKLKSTLSQLLFRWHGISFSTRPEQMQYIYRLQGVDKDWSPPTREEQAIYTEKLKPGSYVFEVKAISKDLAYSEAARMTLKVVSPFYMRAIFLAPTICFGAILLGALIILATSFVRHRRRIRAYEREAVKELQDAREVQMSLMPDSAPLIEGVEIAGKCVSANDVSGDFFDYLPGKHQNEIALVIADVVGKAMKGAMNAMMTAGILHMAAKRQEKLSPASLLMEINDILKARTERLMNVTMAIGVIDAANKILTIANAGILPLLLRDSKVLTLKLGDLPLGMITGIEYTEEQFPLQSGDVVILMTDGIIEAMDSEERYYSDSGRLEKTISQFTPELSAEAIVDAIIADAVDFGGDKTTRDDDMTVVVAKMR